MVWTTLSSVKPSSAACARIAALINAVSAITRRTTKAMRRCSGVVSVLARRACAVSLPA